MILSDCLRRRRGAAVRSFVPRLEALEGRWLSDATTTGITVPDLIALYRLDAPNLPGGGVADGHGQTIAIINAGGIQKDIVGSFTRGARGAPGKTPKNFFKPPRHKFSAENGLTQFGAFDPAGQTPFYLIVGPDGDTDSA